MLTVKNLKVFFPGKEQQKVVIDELSFTVPQGECVALVGESGSGKSLTALSIMQLLPFAARVARHSEIIFHGEDLLLRSEQQMRQVRGSKIGMIFQDAMSAFNPVFTIGYQIQEALCCHRICKKNQAAARAKEYLHEVGIKDPQRVFNAYAHQLSGGMRQRAMIALAICCEPQLIIADEPTTALDVTLQAQILTLLKSIQRQHRTSLLFISHDLAIVSQLANDIIVLKHGKCVEHQTATQFYQQPQHAYSRQLLAAIPPLVAVVDAQQQQPILTTHELAVYFSDRRTFPYLKKPTPVKAVDGVNLVINAAETLALVGESGSGKTTVAKALVKLNHISQGEVIFDSTQFRQDIQMVFQDPYAALNPKMLIAESIMEGMRAQHTEKNQAARLAKVDELLLLVKLNPDMKWRYPHEFSGGERQRICIARALALDPKILILDEPTSALDVSIQKQVLDLLKEIQQRKHIAYLLITHNLSVVAYMAHDIAVMRDGKIVEHGATATVLTQPQHAYTQRLLAAVPTISL